jgi:hypothetical protein
VTFQTERWATYVVDAPPLWQNHYKEVALNQAEIPLDMDLARYEQLDALGMLHIVTARTGGALVGYFTGVVSPHLHYRSTLHCLVDLYWLEPLWRRGTLALKLFGHAHRTLKDRGVVKVMSGTKIHNALDNSRLFEFMHYTLAEKQYTKLL